MHRCLQLAALGRSGAPPNPMVGAVLVYDHKIIGEGYHRKYGEAHAEVNCLATVAPQHEHLISGATLYVSLEPCAHWGKTPPCADLIIRYKIPKVIVGCRDPFDQVNGKGIEKLRQAGVEVMTGVLEDECIDVNKRFFTFHQRNRSYIILKWAQTGDRKIAAAHGERLHISNEYTNRLVHKWRSEEASILVGTRTALADNPELTTRLWPGANPVRLVVDRNLRLPQTGKLFNGRARTIIFNTLKNEEAGNLSYVKTAEGLSLPFQISATLKTRGLQSLIVEGGARLLQTFIDEDLWDEARIITNESLYIGNGLPAPLLHGELKSTESIYGDTVRVFYNKRNLG